MSARRFPGKSDRGPPWREDLDRVDGPCRAARRPGRVGQRVFSPPALLGLSRWCGAHHPSREMVLLPYSWSSSISCSIHFSREGAFGGGMVRGFRAGRLRSDLA
ncbi:uncharacterized protein K489DRAFT_99080 [Dissoconium aciculare CBS 342.82]|uniref:Uncharacterized protein n=1 Tax=Dissoconium aciculare CBS 342.82 TaxID=1314786 RepID=A0A6J3MDY0_9PEZI|nr:uncharacterized protein K489DRAFT_99080 [Dissoconium aciculare CBS 342.82]KAF1825814.1 hypothetical protein K489DRAFT_99080 [Dissoconium aciculare CBS 342.82]